MTESEQTIQPIFKQTWEWKLKNHNSIIIISTLRWYNKQLSIGISKWRHKISVVIMNTRFTVIAAQLQTCRFIAPITTTVDRHHHILLLMIKITLLFQTIACRRSIIIANAIQNAVAVTKTGVTVGRCLRQIAVEAGSLADHQGEILKQNFFHYEIKSM